MDTQRIVGWINKHWHWWVTILGFMGALNVILDQEIPAIITIAILTIFCVENHLNSEGKKDE